MAKGPAEAERTVVRKIDWAVLPILFVMYMLAFLDRSNIGNAQVAGMGRDLGISDREFQWLLTIFYIVYACSEGLTVMWLLMPPNVWAFLCALLWGLASALQAAAPKTNHGWEYLMVFRLLLAMAEAGFGPGIPYLLSCFYTRAEIGLRIGIFFSAAPLASSFAGALAYTVTRIPGESWRWLFLVEGLPTLVMAVVAVKWLPGGPNEVRSLSAAQREIVRDRLVDQTGSAQVRERDFIWAEARTALMDPTVWCYTLMYFSCNVSFASLPVYFPIILEEAGVQAVNAQGLTVPPYLVSFLACIATTWAADVIRKRGSIVVATSLTGFFGFALLRVLPESLWWRYFSLFFATVGVFSTIPNLLPWILNNQGTDSARATSIVLINFIGQCGPLLGTRLFPADQAPYHMTGILICGLLMLFTSALAAILSYVFMSRNRELERRENLMGVAHLQAGREVERPGVVGYRYML
ncbi:major facilitator superfamily transporter [Podospora appendiculata]|uniref:Major facilitator superfamily transporter n=1 Tax=Podospora appendiculata TaxID=314037 RepID=A0AAE1CFC2_9PEZI|nr:major facilitator superfamily transporter [Podospora appendiculata]